MIRKQPNTTPEAALVAAKAKLGRALADVPKTRELRIKRAMKIQRLAREISDLKAEIRGDYAGADPTNYPEFRPLTNAKRSAKLLP